MRVGLGFGVACLCELELATAGDWPQWRGPDRTGHVAQQEHLPDSLPASLKPVWKLEIGGGFSSPVVASGKLVYLDARDGKEEAHAIETSSGREIWHTGYAEVFEDEWGPGPRSTPTMDGDRVYVQSCDGEFRCLNLADGKTIWRVNFDKDFGVKFLGSKANEGTATRRGNDGSCLVDGNYVFVPVGGDGASLVCFDKLKGQVVWKSQKDEAAYSSPVMATIGGIRQVVYFSADALMGIEASTGKLLWRVPLKTNAKRHASTPVIRADSVMVNSHTFGLISFKIASDGSGQSALRGWMNPELKINVATPVMAGDFLYCQGSGKDFVCVDAATGKQEWSRNGFGEKYDSAITDGKELLILTDSGELVLIACDGSAYKELGRTQACGKTWSHPAFSNGKLFVREGLTSGWKLSCFDLGADTVLKVNPSAQ
jgi:outer membrane protein assembly factor BamB